MRIFNSWSFSLPAFIFSLSCSVTASAGTELVNNGNFGSADAPSASGWTSVSSTLKLRPQSTPYGCNQFACYGGTKDVWACSSSATTSASFNQESGIIQLKPQKRYRVSFYGFRDVSSTSTDRTTPSSLVVRVKSGAADYAIKDVPLAPMNFGGFTIGVDRSSGFEFVTPTELSPANQPNLDVTKLYFSFDGTKSNNTGAICLSRVSLQEVDEPFNVSKVKVNTIGYPMAGKKVATLSLQPQTTGAQSIDISGYTWRVLYKGYNSPVYSYSVSINHFAVKTDALGQPIKDAAGKYILDTDSTGAYKVVGGTGTGGQGNYFPPNNGTLPTGAVAKLDADTGEYTYALDFSDLGIQRNEPVTIPDGLGTPSQYTDSTGKVWYILSGNSYSTSSTNESNEYSITVKDKSGNTVATSQQFAITNAPFNNLKKDALYSFYHQRSGEAIQLKYGIGDKAENTPRNHAAGHLDETATCFTGKDLHGNDWGDGGSGCTSIAASPKDVSGGWYDAADHGKYVVNGGVALWTLQNMIERLQKKGALNSAFPAGTLGLPTTIGSNGGTLSNLSDLMAEARKEMEWMMKMQIPTSYVMNVPVGNQATKQQPDTNNTLGPKSANTGVYQVKIVEMPQVVQIPIYRTLLGRKYIIGYNTVTTTRKIETPVASDVAGDVSYAGGTLPKLRIKLALTPEDVGGMVFHSVNDTSWTGIPLDPSTYSKSSNGYIDPKTNQLSANHRQLMYPTSAATLNFAAVAAQCSRIWKGVDDKFAGDCLAAAKNAWTAANRFAARGHILRYEYTNTTATASTAADGSWSTADPSGKNGAILQYGFALNPMFNGGGAYGDLRVGDEFLWASKELTLADGGSYPTTGLLGDCSGSSLQCYSWISGLDWQNVSPLGYLSSWTYNPASTNTDAAKIISAATTFAGYATPNGTSAQGYTFSKIRYSDSDRNSHYDWGANGGVLNRSLVMLAAYEANLSKVAQANRDYCKNLGTTGYQNAAWAASTGFTSEKTACTNAYKALDGAVNSMGYLLGRNTLEKSFISGYGSNNLSSAHHRWFAKPADVNFPSIPAGFIAGGPNTRDLPALRANASRYTFANMSAWLAAHPNATEANNTEWQVGDISDGGQKYLETQIVTKCTTGLGNADSRWTIPAANTSGAVTYTPQKCYGDDYRSFATNEIAVNWQAPLVWVSQFLSEIYQ